MGLLGLALFQGLLSIPRVSANHPGVTPLRLSQAQGKPCYLPWDAGDRTYKNHCETRCIEAWPRMTNSDEAHQEETY